MKMFTMDLLKLQPHQSWLEKSVLVKLQLSPKWRCNFLHFGFATFGIFIMQ